MPRILLAAAFLQAASLVHADLHVVNENGSGDFVSAQAAVDAAQSGDVILIENSGFGSYAPFLVDGKALAIVGEDGVTISGAVTFRNVPAGASATLANLDITGFTPYAFEPDGYALIVENCLGLVVVQDCDLRGGGDASGSPSAAGGTAALASNSTEVAFVRTHVTGGNGPLEAIYSDCFWYYAKGEDGGAGLVALNSTIYASDSSFTGGNGQTHSNEGGLGGNGASSDLSILASRCTFQGGTGGDATEPFCDWEPGDGGDGLSVSGTALILEGTLIGGAAGFGAGFGFPGQAYTGPVDLMPGKGRSLFAASLVESPAPLSMDLDGLQGEHVYLLIASALDTLLTPYGVLLAPAPAIIPLGAVPPGGSLLLSLPLPALPPGLDHIVLHAQALFADPTGVIKPRLSGSSTLIWL